MTYGYKTTPAFRKALANLSPARKDSARRAFAIFKNDPFDARLRVYKIHALSARFRRTMYSVRVEDDLRVIFFLDGDIVVSVDIGSHDLYRELRELTYADIDTFRATFWRPPAHVSLKTDCARASAPPRCA